MQSSPTHEGRRSSPHTHRVGCPTPQAVLVLIHLWANPKSRKSLLHRPQSCDLLYSQGKPPDLATGYSASGNTPYSLPPCQPPENTPSWHPCYLRSVSCIEGLLHLSALVRAVTCIPGRPLFFLYAVSLCVPVPAPCPGGYCTYPPKTSCWDTV